jgi:putative ABC transport system permease protein
MLSDLRYSARALRRSPGFTAVAVATLALGIGATTAIFSVVEAELLRPLPYAEPEALVWLTRPTPKRPQGQIITPQFQAWRMEARSFSGFAAWNDEQFNLTRAGEPERVVAASVNADFLRTLGVSPLLGRDFTVAEDQGIASRSVLLGYELWRRHFASNLAAIGRQVALNDAPYTIIGVLPREFRFPGDLRPELLVPGGYSSPPAWSADSVGLLQVIARLRSGVTPAQISDEIEAIEGRHAGDYLPGFAETVKSGRVRLTPLADQLNGLVRRPLVVLWGAVSLVLLLICANVAGLELARSAGRTGELAVRAALGAGRARLVRLVAGESLLVAAAGGALGVVGASWLIGAMRTVEALGLPYPESVRMNGPVLAFAIAISLAAGLLASVAPALAASRPDLVESIKISSRSVTRGWRGGLRAALVVGQVALALMLLLGAGLLLRSMEKLLSVPLGFRPGGVLSLRMRLPQGRYSDSRRSAFVEDLLSRARSLPGVEHAAVANSIPFTNYNLGMTFRLEGQPLLPPGQNPGAAVLTVTADYFAAISTPLLAGRTFQSSDATEPVIVVNRSFARKHFGDGIPLGRRVRLGVTDESAPWFTIVGVVADSRHQGPLRPAEPEIYRPYAGMPAASVGLVVRAGVPPESLVAALRSEIRRMDPELPIFDVATMDDRVANATASQRLQLALIGFFAVVATALAALGVYGAISYAVAQSTHEIGLRLALGAPPGAVQRRVVARGLRLGAAGIGLGLAGGYALAGSLRALLFETPEHDAATFASASVVLLAMALVAAWLPARRAACVDPVIALRAE